jgi:hypothetical protein
MTYDEKRQLSLDIRHDTYTCLRGFATSYNLIIDVTTLITWNYNSYSNQIEVLLLIISLANQQLIP